MISFEAGVTHMKQGGKARVVTWSDKEAYCYIDAKKETVWYVSGGVHRRFTLETHQIFNEWEIVK